jgi:hypothetical protein
MKLLYSRGFVTLSCDRNEFILTVGDRDIRGDFSSVYNEVLDLAQAGLDLDRLMTDIHFSE